MNSAAHSAADATGRTVVVDVWSDVMCPFCYLGDTLLQQARATSPHAVEVRYHSYQLMPELPEDEPMGLYELLEHERGLPRAQAEAMNRQVSARAAEVGLTWRIDDAIATNTRTAHRLMHFANAHGKQHAMAMRLFRAYFTDGLNVGDHGVLADLAAEIGLDRAAALDALRTGAYGAEFEADVRQAHELGITGVPFFVFNGRYAVSGAQPVEVFQQALAAAAGHPPDVS